MKKYVVTLLEEEREALGALTSRGKHRSQKVLNALILLGCDAGEFQTERSTNEEIARVLKISMRKIDRVKRRFVVDGLEVCLNGTKGSRVYAKKADGDLEAHLVALSCKISALRIYWDGRDQAGREVASGIYFVVLTVNGVSGFNRMYVAK